MKTMAQEAPEGLHLVPDPHNTLQGHAPATGSPRPGLGQPRCAAHTQHGWVRLAPTGRSTGRANEPWSRVSGPGSRLPVSLLLRSRCPPVSLEDSPWGLDPGTVFRLLHSDSSTKLARFPPRTGFEAARSKGAAQGNEV